MFFFSTACLCAANPPEVQPLTYLQFEITKGMDILAKPVIQWVGSSDILLVDSQKLVFWKKKKILQVVDPESRTALKIVCAPDGRQFVCGDDSGPAAVGFTDTFDFTVLREKIQLEGLRWSRVYPGFYHIRNGSLWFYDVKKNYSDKICDNAASFFLSSDEYRIIAAGETGKDSFIINADRTFKSSFPPESLYLEKRTEHLSIKNVSPSFRKILRDKPGGKGFLLHQIDWKNKLTSLASLLEDFHGNRDAVFSSDGSKIALSCRDESGKYYMVVLTSSGEVLVKFGLKKGWIYRNPLWSPDGKWILWNYIDPGKPEGERNRYLLSDPRGVSIQIVPKPLSSSDLYWSPRSDQIVFREEEKPFEAGEYVVYDPGKQMLKPLFKDAKSRATSIPVWSPDGRCVAIIDYSTFQKREKKVREVKKVPVEVESVYFREQLFFFKPYEDALQLIW